MEEEEGENDGFKVFVGGLDWQTTEDGLAMYFEQFGPVHGSTIMRDRFTGQPRGFGFVSFGSDEAVRRVLDHKGHSIDGKEVEVKHAKRNSGPGGGGGGGLEDGEDGREAGGPVIDMEDIDKKLFVGGIYTDTSEQQVEEYFSKFGKVKNVIIKYDPTTKRSRGFGFVTFCDSDGFERANRETRHMICGKRVETKPYSQGAAHKSNVNTAPSTSNEEIEQQIKAFVPYSKRKIGDVYVKYFSERAERARSRPPPSVSSSHSRDRRDRNFDRRRRNETDYEDRRRPPRRR